MKFRQYLEASIPLGDCFRFATKKGAELYHPRTNKDVAVCHGEVKSKWDKAYHPHAWVEFDGKAVDWQMNLSGVTMKLDDFYDFYKPKKIKRYKPGELVGLMAKHGHWGPF